MLKFDEKILIRSKNPLYLKEINSYSQHSLNIDLAYLKSKISIQFNLKQAQELIITKISYQTGLIGPYLGVLDYFIELIQDRAIEAIDRVNIKEFDHYIRSSKETAAFSFYNNELYEVLGIGEKIFHYLNPKKQEIEPLVKAGESFFGRSFSEQIELIEEMLAINFYRSLDYQDIQIEVEDISVQQINLLTDSDKLKELQDYLSHQIEIYLVPNKDFNLRIRQDNS